jgi:hypothetical protein
MSEDKTLSEIVGDIVSRVNMTSPNI